MFSIPPLGLGAPDPSALAGAFAAMGCVIWLLVLVFAVAFPIFCFWRIFTKAGFSGALSLLWLVPFVGPIIVICILAFGEWPSLKR